MSQTPLQQREINDAFSSRHAGNGWASRNAMICGLVVVVCILACRPFAEIPYVDDWSMARTARIFAQTGHVAYNGWAAMPQGWQIVWGAIFINIFGFSYTVLRLSLLPVVFTTIYLFQISLAQFRFTQRRATFGALVFGLSPIFLPVASSFMTDIPGVAVILLCLFLCQKAIAAPSSSATILWLTAAALTNLVGGTVRQTSFLGVLVMVPSVGWALRRRRGVLTTAGCLTAVSGLVILGYLKWYLAQPYSVPEHFLRVEPNGAVLIHLAGQLLTAFLLLLLSVLPALGLFSLDLLRLGGKTFWTGVATTAATLVALVATRHLTPLGVLFSKFNIDLRLPQLLLCLALVSAVLAITRLLISRQMRVTEPRISSADWKEILSLLGPYSLAYFLLLLPRGAAGWIWDRYLLGLIPLVIIVVLKLHQQYVDDRITPTAVVLLACLALFGIGRADKHYAEKRALVKAIAMLRADNVPRSAISAGFEYNCETEAELSGHLNEPKVQVPAGAYRPYTPPPRLPPSVRGWFNSYTPSVKPQFFVLSDPDPSLAATK